MMVLVLWLRIIVLQSLLLTVATAIESVSFHLRLGMGQKTCVQYAGSLNLLAAAAGWLVFYVIRPRLPLEAQYQMVRLVFFERSWPNATPVANNRLLALFIIILLFTIGVKLVGMQLLTLLLKEPTENDNTQPSRSRQRQMTRRLLNIHRPTDQTLNFIYTYLLSQTITSLMILVLVKYAELKKFLPI